MGKFSTRFSTRRRIKIAPDALPGDRKIQRPARDLPTARRKGPDDAGRFELCFELDRLSPQNLLANHGDGRLRFARALDRQLERFDGVRDYPRANFGGSARVNEIN